MNTAVAESQISEPDHTGVFQRFQIALEASPDSPAAVHNGQSLSYRELNEMADKIAAMLSRYDCRSHTRVAIAIDHSFHMVAAVLAVLKLGATYIPLDRRNPETRLLYILEDSNASILLHDNAASDLAIEAPVTRLKVSQMNRFQANLEPAPIRFDDLAYILYTSGSTGTPKGVGITHANLSNYVDWAADQYFKSQDDRIALYSTLAFDFTVTCIFPPLVKGASIGIYDGISDPMVIREILLDTDVNILKITPSYLYVLSQMHSGQSHISRLIVGGEDLSVALAKRVTEQVGNHLEIINEYGPTEATVGCIYHRYIAELCEGSSVPIGAPIPNVEVFLIDDQGRPVDEHAGGELCLAGKSVAPGYINLPLETQDKFVEYIAGSYPTFYKTGDHVRKQKNGEWLYLGRRDDQVKIRGNRVELSEVTQAILAVDDVSSAFATTILEHNTNALVAVFTSDTAKHANEVLSELRQALPNYMVPSILRKVDRIPMTTNQKVDKDKVLFLLKQREFKK